MPEDTEDLRFDDRVVLITGAGRGMGKAHAQLFARLGAKVVVADTGVSLYGAGSDVTIASDVARELCNEGASASSYGADLATEGGARGAVRHALERFGRLDAIVHNAGFTLGAMPMAQESLDRVEKQLWINTRAAFLICQEAWPHFQSAAHGRIVIAGSTAMYGLPRSTPYSLAKASYIGLCRALADEGVADGINVNLVAPSGATRMAENMPDSAFRNWFLEQMKPELVSPAVAWLAHPDCQVTGETFVVGGGRIARMILSETRGAFMETPNLQCARDAIEASISCDDAVPLGRFDDAMKLMTESLGYQGEDAVQFAGVPDDRS